MRGLVTILDPLDAAEGLGRPECPRRVIALNNAITAVIRAQANEIGKIEGNTIRTGHHEKTE